MDVYFERIAGVTERNAGRKMPRGGEASTEAMVPAEANVAVDEDGFPVSPLRDQDELWFVQAAQLYRPLAVCARTARSDGMVLALCGLLTGLLGLATMHIVTIVVGLILLTIGFMERSSAKDVAAAKPGSTGRLALNQLILLVLVVLYCGSQMQSFHTAYAKTGYTTERLEQAVSQLPAEFGSLSAQLQSVAPALKESVPNLVYAFWALVALASICFQGTLLLYYLTRKRHLRHFYGELPPWVVKIVKTIVTAH